MVALLGRKPALLSPSLLLPMTGKGKGSGADLTSNQLERLSELRKKNGPNSKAEKDERANYAKQRATPQPAARKPTSANAKRSGPPPARWSISKAQPRGVRTSVLPLVYKDTTYIHRAPWSLAHDSATRTDLVFERMEVVLRNSSPALSIGAGTLTTDPAPLPTTGDATVNPSGDISWDKFILVWKPRYDDTTLAFFDTHIANGVQEIHSVMGVRSLNHTAAAVEAGHGSTAVNLVRQRTAPQDPPVWNTNHNANWRGRLVDAHLALQIYMGGMSMGQVACTKYIKDFKEMSAKEVRDHVIGDFHATHRTTLRKGQNTITLDMGINDPTQYGTWDETTDSGRLLPDEGAASGWVIVLQRFGTTDFDHPPLMAVTACSSIQTELGITNNHLATAEPKAARPDASGRISSHGGKPVSRGSGDPVSAAARGHKDRAGLH